MGADRALSQRPESRARKTPNHPRRKPPLIGKIPAFIKIKLALPRPPFPNNPDPTKIVEFYGHGGFPAERTKTFQAPENWCSHFRPQNCRQKNYGYEAFSEFSTVRNFGWSLVFVNELPHSEASSLAIQVFRGTSGSMRPSFGLCFARRASDLCPLISFHDEAPWTGHLMLNVYASYLLPKLETTLGFKLTMRSAPSLSGWS